MQKRGVRPHLKSDGTCRLVPGSNAYVTKDIGICFRYYCFIINDVSAAKTYLMPQRCNVTSQSVLLHHPYTLL